MATAVNVRVWTSEISQDASRVLPGRAIPGIKEPGTSLFLGVLKKTFFKKRFRILKQAVYK